MYNTDIPTRAELPTSRQLLKSTAIAIVAASALLVTVVLPAEYGIDPTGAGRALQLTEMGEIKQQLAAEAEADRRKDRDASSSEGTGSLLDRLAGLFVGTAHAQAATPTEAPAWTDTVSFKLTPGEGTEIKLTMKEGARAQFFWASKGGVVNFDQHGDGSGKDISYAKGRGVSGQDGTLVAAFTGNHGWFWRNRTKNDVTVTLNVRGDYGEIIRQE